MKMTVFVFSDEHSHTCIFFFFFGAFKAIWLSSDQYHVEAL